MRHRKQKLFQKKCTAGNLLFDCRNGVFAVTNDHLNSLSELAMGQTSFSAVAPGSAWGDGSSAAALWIKGRIDVLIETCGRSLGIQIDRFDSLSRDQDGLSPERMAHLQ